MAFFVYHDRPGVVGIVGRLLGEAGVNIASMQLGREGEDALIVLNVDSEIPSTIVQRITHEIGAHSGQTINLIG
jgi:D-3-phosphoglycerate dehydrogenase